MDKVAALSVCFETTQISTQLHHVHCYTKTPHVNVSRRENITHTKNIQLSLSKGQQDFIGLSSCAKKT